MPAKKGSERGCKKGRERGKDKKQYVFFCQGSSGIRQGQIKRFTLQMMLNKISPLSIINY